MEGDDRSIIHNPGEHNAVHNSTQATWESYDTQNNADSDRTNEQQISIMLSKQRKSKGMRTKEK